MKVFTGESSGKVEEMESLDTLTVPNSYLKLGRMDCPYGIVALSEKIVLWSPPYCQCVVAGDLLSQLYSNQPPI